MAEPTRKTGAPWVPGGQGHMCLATGRETQNVLETDSPSREDTSFHLQSSWSKKIFSGLKTAGLGLGCVVCGAIALGLLPLTVIGIGLAISGRHKLKKSKDKDAVESDAMKAAGERERTAGRILAAPLIGCLRCIREIKNIVTDSQDLRGLAQDAEKVMKEFPDQTHKDAVSMNTMIVRAIGLRLKNLNNSDLKKFDTHIQGLSKKFPDGSPINEATRVQLRSMVQSARQQRGHRRS